MDDSGPGAAAQVRTVVAVGGLVVAVSYVVGAAILTLQLVLQDLPTVGIVGAVPRESAVANGVSLVVAPATAYGIVYALIRFSGFSGWAPPATHRRWNQFTCVSDRSARLWLRLAWFVELGIGVVVLAAPGMLRADRRYGWSPSLLYAALAIVPVMVATMLGYLHGRARMAERWPLGDHGNRWMRFVRLHEIPLGDGSPASAGPASTASETARRTPGTAQQSSEPPEGTPETSLEATEAEQAIETSAPQTEEKKSERFWSRPVPVVIGATLAAAAAVPALTAYWAVGTLPNAVACLSATDGASSTGVKGVLVAQTNERVYLGEPGNRKGVLQTFSADAVDGVLVRSNDVDDCRASTAADDPSGESAAASATVDLAAEKVTKLLTAYDHMWRRHHELHEQAWKAHRLAARRDAP
jgi:hypothetical protein